MHISEFRLRKGISEQEFIPFYQPVVAAKNKQIVGCEVLARWLMPEKGLVNAGLFIDDIKRFMLVEEMTRQLASDVIEDFFVLSDISCLNEDFLLTLNVSLTMLMDPVFSDWLLILGNMLKEMGVTPVFEITEREDVSQFPQAENVFRELVTQGMYFAVDDFGTGYATETLVTASRSRFIKIDHHYTGDPQSTFAENFITQTIRFARTEDIRVIAEGVQTAEQEEWLINLGVDYLQGYRFGAPMPFGIFRYRFEHSSEYK